MTSVKTHTETWRAVMRTDGNGKTYSPFQYAAIGEKLIIRWWISGAWVSIALDNESSIALAEALEDYLEGRLKVG